MEITRQMALDSDEFEVIQDDLIDHRRWAVRHRIILKRVSDGTFWKGLYDVGATENQDGYDEDIFVQQVFPMQVEITVYVTEQEIQQSK